MTDSKLIFVHPVLTPFPPGVSPTHETIEKCQTELNDNAGGIQSAAGGNFGHLALTVTTKQYILITENEDYEAPTNPGDNPVQLEDATQFQIAEANRAHLVNKKIYDLYYDVNMALKKQLLAACPDLFLESMKQPHIGYGGRTVLQLLTHLHTNYGQIEQDQLVANEKRMRTPWHTTEPIETLFSQLKNTFEFALAGNAGITELQVVRIGYEIILATGMFKEDLKDWRRKPITEWTMATFKIFFKKANRDRLSTTSDGGYHTANAAVTPSAQAEIASLKAEIAALKKATKTKTVPSTISTSDTMTSGLTSYCHTHGTSTNLTHSSKTCKQKGKDHKDDATEEIKMGGSSRIWSNADRKQRE